MKKLQTIVIAGDLHLGEHDSLAIAAFLAHLKRLQPDQLILNGDIIDCTEIHRMQRGTRQPIGRKGRSSLTTGEEIILARVFLKTLKDLIPTTQITYIEGNHEARYPRLVAESLPEVYRSVPTMPDLLGLKDLKIDWLAYNQELTVGNFRVFHGRRCNVHAARSEGQSSGDGSLIQGHTHRLKMYSQSTCPGDTVLVLTKPWSHAVQVVNNRLLHEWRQDMAKTRKRYQKRSPDQWKQLIAEQRSSGQSMRGFARSRCICESSMWRWSKLLDLEGESDQDKTRHALSGAESRGGGLVELVTQHQRFDVEPRSDEVRMLVGSGVCLELSRLPAPEYLALVAHTYDAMSS